MNREQIELAIYKKENPSKIVSWWRKNNYKVLRVMLWYIYIPMMIHEKIVNRRIKNFSENKTKTRKYLDKAFPKIVAHYCPDISCILIVLGFDPNNNGDFCTEDFKRGYVIGKKAAKYFSLLTIEQRKQMIIDYQIDGYKKMMLTNWQDWSKAEQKFNWPPNWGKDYDKGVVFYISEEK